MEQLLLMAAIYLAPLALLIIGVATFYAKQLRVPTRILIGGGFVLPPAGGLTLLLLTPVFHAPIKLYFGLNGLGIVAALIGIAMMLVDGTEDKISGARLGSIIVGMLAALAFTFGSYVAIQLGNAG